MKRIIAAFLNSCAGLIHALRTERAVQQETVLLVLAVPLSLVVGSDLEHRVLLVGVILAMIGAELLNTCIEKLCDHVTPQIHPQIKAVKDMGSAGVFCFQLLAAMVWVMAILQRAGLA